MRSELALPASQTVLLPSCTYWASPLVVAIFDLAALIAQLDRQHS